MARSLRVGMISFAHVHAEFRSKALREISGVEIVAIADDDVSRGQAAAATHHVQAFYPDYKDLLARDDIDFVFIHAENNRHAEIVEAAAAAGKGIFCEKPMANTIEDAERIARAVRESGVRFTVGFVSRYVPEAERVKAIVDSGALGTITAVRALIGLAGIREIGCPASMADWMEDPVRGGGGALIDEGSHAVDLLRWYAGDVEAVSATTASLIKHHLPVEDTAVATLRFASGALGELYASWSLHIDIGMRNVIEMYGSAGTLIAELTAPAPSVRLYCERETTPHLAGWITPHIKPAANEPHDYQSWPTNALHYRREVEDVVRRIREGLPFRAGLDDGMQACRFIAAGYQSARNRAEVRLDSPSA
jgi:predicted dehydrogenase